VLALYSSGSSVPSSAENSELSSVQSASSLVQDSASIELSRTQSTYHNVLSSAESHSCLGQDLSVPGPEKAKLQM
jgi:hypothetical protein